MPQGVILSSASHGAKQEDVEKVLAGAGLEVEKEEPEKKAEEVVVEEEPARDDFETEEEFEEAHVAWQDSQKAKEEEGEEEDEEDEQKAAAEEPKPKLSKMQKRIRRATEKATENIRRENSELKRRIEALEKSGKLSRETILETIEEVKNPRPVRANYKSDEEYEDALVKWGVAKALAEEGQKETEKQINDRLKANLKHYGAAVATFKETHDDWDEKLSQDLPMHTGVQLTIMDPDAIPNPAEVIYYLANHPVYTQNLAEKSPEAAIAEVGRLSARLLKTDSGSKGSRAGSGNNNPKPKRRAPEPIRPVSTAATSSTLTSADAAKARNYKAFKQAQRAGR